VPKIENEIVKHEPLTFLAWLYVESLDCRHWH